MNTYQETQSVGRTNSILNTANSLGYAVVLFALLADIMVRSIIYHEGAWDLFAIIFLSGGVSIAYAIYHRCWRNVITRKTIVVAAVSGIIAAIVGSLVAVYL